MYKGNARMSKIFQQIIQAQSAIQEEFLRRKGVVGVAVGYKETKGVITDEQVMVVMVEQKRPLDALTADEIIPDEVNGIRTDVYEVGHLVAHLGPQDRHRPTIPAGVSIGHYKVTAGTLGVIVRDRTTTERFILSNNHVLANVNDAQKGDPILQPGSLDGGQNPGDVVANLERFIPLIFLEDTPSLPVDEPTPDPPTVTEPAGCAPILAALATMMNSSSSKKQSVPISGQSSAKASSAEATTNLVDCALARPVDTTMFSDQIRNIGVVLETREPQLGMRIRKSGRTTDYTESVVTLLNATVDVGYDTAAGARTARFTEQIICEPMSQGGDSGSLIVDTAGNYAVGLLFAGSPLATIFTPIDTVLNVLNVTLG
jgi:hypothetical protein